MAIFPKSILNSPTEPQLCCRGINFNPEFPLECNVPHTKKISDLWYYKNKDKTESTFAGFFPFIWNCCKTIFAEILPTYPNIWANVWIWRIWRDMKNESCITRVIMSKQNSHWSLWNGWRRPAFFDVVLFLLSYDFGSIKGRMEEVILLHKCFCFHT